MLKYIVDIDDRNNALHFDKNLVFIDCDLKAHFPEKGRMNNYKHCCLRQKKTNFPKSRFYGQEE